MEVEEMKKEIRKRNKNICSFFVRNNFSETMLGIYQIYDFFGSKIYISYRLRFSADIKLRNPQVKIYYLQKSYVKVTDT